MRSWVAGLLAFGVTGDGLRVDKQGKGVAAGYSGNPVAPGTAAIFV